MAETENGNGYTFTDGIEKLACILTQAAGELETFAESFKTSDEELAELNAGKTEAEIKLEDAVAAQIAAPLVNALDGISGILNGATAKVAEMTARMYDGHKQTGGV
jgi:hypothetical protein